MADATDPQRPNMRRGCDAAGHGIHGEKRYNLDERVVTNDDDAGGV